MNTFQKGAGNWTQYQQLPGLIEIDLHFSGPREIPYWDAMAEVYKVSLQALRDAYEQQRKYVLFRHGSSTSSPGKTTARSVVRGLMRGKEATPYIDRARCIQHESVFVVGIKPKRVRE